MADKKSTGKAREPREASEPEKPRRGRPPGTGQGSKVRKIGISLPDDLWAWLKKQDNASATVTEALREYTARHKLLPRR